jgi:hypothetical protein
MVVTDPTTVSSTEGEASTVDAGHDPPASARTDGGGDQAAGDGEQSAADLFKTVSWQSTPAETRISCADCGMVRDLIGPFSLDGDVIKGGDMVCRDCADGRGADLTHCTCGVSSPREITCPGCNDYLGYSGDCR